MSMYHFIFLGHAFTFFLCVYRYVEKISVECSKINSDVRVLPLETYQ